MKIRPRHDDDLDELVILAARVRAEDGYPIYLPDGDFVRFLTQPSPTVAWVAVANRRIVGHVALNAETSPPVMRLAAELVGDRGAIFVARLLVDPAARRQGIGRVLLERAMSAATAVGHVAMLDVVDTAAASSAISLYRRAGWEEVGRVGFELMDIEIDELVFRGPVFRGPAS